MKTRLNKYLADRGICSRRGADALIADGQVLVNGKRAEFGMMVDTEDEILVEGQLVAKAEPQPIYIAFHKPVGLITSVDPTLRDTVIDYLNLDERVFPIGRLDVASSGLLLLTNDGRLSEAITHPRKNHEKEYVVTLDRSLARRDAQTMMNGMEILGRKTKPAVVKSISDEVFAITLTEGRNRQIRRMCEALGYEVKRLKRVRVMNIWLGELPVGKWRYLNDTEVRTLKKRLELDGE